MIYSKVNPVGMDKNINLIQGKLEEVFIALGFSTGQFDIYDRIYRVKEDVGIYPERFISSGYKKTLFSDDKALTTYFYERAEATNNHGMFSVLLGQVVHANLTSFFPSVATRADHELVKILMDAYSREPYGFRLVSFVTGVDKVFSDFIYDTKLEDMQPYFIFRIDLNLNFRI